MRVRSSKSTNLCTLGKLVLLGLGFRDHLVAATDGTVALVDLGAMTELLTRVLLHLRVGTRDLSLQDLCGKFSLWFEACKSSLHTGVSSGPALRPFSV